MKPLHHVVSLALLLHTAGAQEPPPAPVTAFAPHARVLFQGDSITDGNRGRSPDPNHILGHGYAFLIAAKFGAAFPENQVDFMNRGVSANTVADLEKRWQKDTLDLKPGLLSILVGVNDAGRNVPLDQFEQGYDRLLTAVRAADPGIKLVLCEPFTLPVGGKKADYEAWSADMRKRGEVVAKLARKHGAAFVRLQPVFEAACQRAPAEYWMWDGVHPTYAGHQLLADEWVRTVRANWPEK